MSHGCLWVSEVPECVTKKVVIDDEGGEFECPPQGAAGTFTKHAHPLDCRQFFLCINGIPREQVKIYCLLFVPTNPSELCCVQGCPLGEVFSAGTGSGEDGRCTDPEEVPECADYYAGVDTRPSVREGGRSANPGRAARLN